MGFALSRASEEVRPFLAVRSETFGAVRFLPRTEPREPGFPALRFFAARLPRVFRATEIARRAGRLAEWVADGRALPRLRAEDFLAGLEGFLAMFILLGWTPREAPLSDGPQMGALGKTSNHNIPLGW